METIVTYCQGSRYNARCSGGSRLCRQYGGLWLCVSKCWRHRLTIAVLAGTEKERKGVRLSSSRRGACVETSE